MQDLGDKNVLVHSSTRYAERMGISKQKHLYMRKTLQGKFKEINNFFKKKKQNTHLSLVIQQAQLKHSNRKGRYCLSLGGPSLFPGLTRHGLI